MALKQYQLKLGDTTYESNFAKNAVLEQHFNGQRIKAGTKLAMGSEISLVLGSGLGQDQIPVPDLFGKTYIEAKVMLESYGINLGMAMFDPGTTDSANAFIKDQKPLPLTPDGRNNMIRQGQSIDIFLQVQRPERAVPDTTHN
jgi:beta-lactam-binding protein with PASTA domain